jgi:predicted nucleic acid-binding protein
LTTLVVDASAAVHLASMSTVPDALGAFDCVAPPLMWSEAISTLVEATFRGAIPAAELDAGAERLEALPIALAAVDAGHRRRSIEIARTLGWAKTYDAEYVSLAQALGCPLLTVDRRLMRGAARLIELIGPESL